MTLKDFVRLVAARHHSFVFLTVKFHYYLWIESSLYLHVVTEIAIIHVVEITAFKSLPIIISLLVSKHNKSYCLVGIFRI